MDFQFIWSIPQLISGLDHGYHNRFAKGMSAFSCDYQSFVYDENSIDKEDIVTFVLKKK